MIYNTSRVNCSTAISDYYQTVHLLDVRSVTNFVDHYYGLAIFLLCINIILPFLTVLGNLIVILTVFVYRQLRVPANLLIATLSVSDLLTGLIAQPSHVNYLLRAIQHNTKPCYDTSSIFFHTVAFLTITASITCLGLITYDRYIAIVHSLRYVTIMTLSRTRLAILSLWIISTMMASTVYLLSPLFQEVRFLSYTYGILLCIFIIAIYAKLHRISRKHALRIKNEQSSIGRNKENKLERRSLITISMVIMSLAFSFLPHILLAAKMRLDKSNLLAQDVAKQFTLTVILMNSTINPLLYFFRSPKLRNYSRKLFTKGSTGGVPVIPAFVVSYMRRVSSTN
uniref:Adrenocorticotropic hormone receptor-like n=1 Tax=Actinia tenebrosa TaxID=6105 RepID=A0A6P8I8R3_ACTTE